MSLLQQRQQIGPWRAKEQVLPVLFEYSTNAVVSDLLTPSGDAANYSLILSGTSGCQVKCLCFAFLDTIQAEAILTS